jgi:hypothetical protein
MTVTCETLAVKKPANITAINKSLTTNDCDEPCSVDASFTWQNTGGRAGTFEPAIVVNGIRTGSGLSINMPPNQTYLYTFTLSGLLEGNYTVCPDPN